MPISPESRIPSVFYGITIGQVVDVNDPQQMGRIRVMCPALGDSEDLKVTDIQWASYASPFGGIVTCGTRGPEQATTSGPVAYGQWAIPKVGSHALVMCLDGHLDYRVWVGCLYGQFLPHTMPSGRWVDSNADGPLTSTENPIEPLYTNFRTAFTDPTDPQKDNLQTTFEGKTRAMDNQVSAVDVEVLDRVITSKADDKNDGGDAPGTATRKGYQKSRQRPEIKFRSTGGNYDSQVFAYTTPGMHSFTMDDSLQNGRIRIRSTSGNQIILDDTNERIYINTSDGANWIELDKQGNIDIYSKKRVSVHAEEGFNFKTGRDFRVDAGQIYLNALSEFRMTSALNMDIIAASDSGHLNIQTGNVLNLTAAKGLNATTGSGNFSLIATNIEVFGAGVLNLQSTTSTNVFSAGVITIQGISTAIQPGGSFPATTVPPTAATFAYTTNRVPQHEPWGRTMLKDTDMDISFNDSLEPEYDYFAAEVGKYEFGLEVEPERNDFWRR